MRLIPTGDPLARVALVIHRRYPDRTPTRLGSTVFGGMGVDSVYLYPTVVTTFIP